MGALGSRFFLGGGKMGTFLVLALESKFLSDMSLISLFLEAQRT